MQCYSDDTIEDMREEKVVLDHPEVADKLLKSNAKVGNCSYTAVWAARKEADA